MADFTDEHDDIEQPSAPATVLPLPLPAATVESTDAPAEAPQAAFYNQTTGETRSEPFDPQAYDAPADVPVGRYDQATGETVYD